MLTLQGVNYLHPNGDLLFSQIDLSINKREKAAVVGNNGVGKSTLLKIIAGDLMPTAGSVVRNPNIYFVPQVLGQFNHLTVGEALRIDQKLATLKEILDGNISAESLELVANDWTIEERVRAAFTYWGLHDISLSQSMRSLSGGQKTKVFLSGIMIDEPELILLDEPSNHLDLASREMLYDFLLETNQTIIAVSHDRALLSRVTVTLELSQSGIKTYGGNYDFYCAQKEIESHALHEELRNREKALRKAKELERETMERKQKLDARGMKKKLKAGVPTIMMNTLRNNAEKSTSKLKAVHIEKTNGISQEIKDCRKEIPDSEKMKLNLNDSMLHKGKILVAVAGLNHDFGSGDLWSAGLDFELRSGERIALAGPNGCGKSTLLKIINGAYSPTSGAIDRKVFKSIYIDQDYSLIRKYTTVYQQALEFNHQALPEHEVKTRLNRFLFNRDDWQKSTDALSGGERMRLILCCLSISTTAPDMIILDEPTNNLDLQSLKIFTDAIREYSGTLLVVSHDQKFLTEIGIERLIEL